MCPNIFFSEDIVPDGYKSNFRTHLYNMNEYVAFKYNGNILTFYIANEKLKQVVGRIHFVITNNSANSLPRDPFGNFELDESISIEVLDGFVSFILAGLRKKKIRNILVSTFAQVYGQRDSAKICYVLLSNGFEISNADMNHHIPVKERFECLIKPMQRRKLLKGRKERLLFKEESLLRLEEVYHFILRCREEKYQSLSLSYAQLRDITNCFSDHYKLFVVRRAGKIIAATVAVVVNSKILYNFYPASAMEFNALSPMVFLTEGVYNYCADNEFRILDLGTSSLREKPNVGLINFKEGIGGAPSLKFVFGKSLD